MERRTVLRAGAVAWAAPVLAAATAAPAFACSPTNSLATTVTFTANYGADVNGVRPDLINVTHTVKNNGGQPSGPYTRTLTIPPNLFDSVSSPQPAGYNPVLPADITGSLVAGWTINYTRTNPLGSGLTDSFAVTLTVGGTTATPFRGWQGKAFTALGGTVSGGATCNTISTTDGVEETPNTTLGVSSWFAFRDDTILWVGTNTAAGAATSFVANTGRKAVGPITLEVTVPRNSSGRFQSVSANAPTEIASDWEFVSPRSTNVDSWTYTFRTTPAARFFAPSQLGAPATSYQTPPFRARIVLTGNSGTNPATSITAIAKASSASDSAPVPDPA